MKKPKKDDQLKIETWPIGKVLTYAKNARLHSDEQIDIVAKSITEFGFVNPCLVDADGILIAGHCRVLSSKKLGMKTVPVIKLGHLTEQQARALRIADNQLPMRATWDAELLRLEVSELKLAGFDMPLLGFDSFQLAGIMKPPLVGNTDPDEAPEPPKRPVSRTGDLWLLGDHRLLCGDSTNENDVARVMGDEKAVLVNTDPPYGINYGDIANSRSRAASVRKGGNGKNYATHVDKEIENDDLDGVQLQAFLEKIIRTALPHLIENPAFYLWHPMSTQGTFFAAAAAADILIHRQIIWVKPSLIMGRGDYHWRHELCFYGWIRGKHCVWLQGRDQNTVWEVGRENDGIHPTQKPVELFLRPINNHTKSGQVIFEPFSGSGSQIIAAEMTGRKCYALEIDARYCDVVITRFEKFTGQKATLDGRTLEQVAKARRIGTAKGAEDAKGKPASIRAARTGARSSDVGLDAAAKP